MEENEKKAIDYYENKEMSFTCDYNTEELLKALGIENNEEDSFENHMIRFKTLINLIKKQDKMINKIIDEIVGDKKILALMCKNIIKKTDKECEKQNLLCDDCIKEYFKKKVEEEENE